MLYGLVRELGPDSIVEVGAFHGFCTMHMAQALEDNGHGIITVIDDYSLEGTSAVHIHNNLNEAGLGHRLNLIDGDSRNVEWPSRVDMAFIDGDHSFEGCLSDCNKAIERGAYCVCIHDTVGWWGPRQYMEAFHQTNKGEWQYLDFPHDSGFAILLRNFPKGPEGYSEKDYPLGHV